MGEASVIVFECPSCGETIEPGEDYVVAREYELAPGFSLHIAAHDETVSAIRRFHVQHFRNHVGDYVYELIHDASR